MELAPLFQACFTRDEPDSCLLGCPISGIAFYASCQVVRNIDPMFD